MKKQIHPTIEAHLIRGAFYLLLLVGVCAIPFALAQRNTDTNANRPAAAGARAVVPFDVTAQDLGTASYTNQAAGASHGSASGLTPVKSVGAGPGAWQPAGVLTNARSRLCVAFFPPNGRFYALGGETTGGSRDIPIEEYNPSTNAWTTRANLLTGVSNTGAATVGNFIYVPGGFDGVTGLTLVQRNDPVANTVTTVAPMPAGNFAHAVAALGTKIYVLGGSLTGVAGTTNYIYDTLAGTWSTGAALLTAVQYPAAASDGTYIYVLGGNTTDLNTVQRYLPVTNAWTTRATMIQGRGGHGAFFDGTFVWAVGGGWTSYFTSTEYYNPGMNTWLAGPSLTTGARTIGAAFGNNLAVKVAGWNGNYVAAAEKLQFAGGTPTCTPGSFTNSTTITIPDSGNAIPYPSNINVSGLSGTVVKVTVTFNNLSHTYTDDVDIMLVGPGGQNATICSDAGGANGIVGGMVALDDAAANQLPDATAFTSGTYRPANWPAASDNFPAPAPTQSANVNLSTFNGTNPNGTWNLYVQDDLGGDMGMIAGGWTLTITTDGPCGTPPYDFNHDNNPDFVLYKGSTRQTAVGYMNNNVLIGGAFGPTLPAGWNVIDVADFDRDGNNDYALFNSSTGQTAILYLSGVTLVGGAFGPTLPNGWTLVATGDFNGDGNPDYVLYKSSTRQTALVYLNDNVVIGAALGPVLPAGWSLAGVADFNRDGHPDYALFISSTGQTVIAYLSGPTVIGAALGPSVPSGWPLVGAADFDGDGNADYVLYNSSTRQTALVYLNDNVVIGAALGPVLPAGWSLVAP